MLANPPPLIRTRLYFVDDDSFVDVLMPEVLLRVHDLGPCYGEKSRVVLCLLLAAFAPSYQTALSFVTCIIHHPFRDTDYDIKRR